MWLTVLRFFLYPRCFSLTVLERNKYRGALSSPQTYRFYQQVQALAYGPRSVV